MDVHLGALKEEEAVVVYSFVAAVEAEEDGFVDVLVVVDELVGFLVFVYLALGVCWGTYLTGVEVEIGRVELVALGEIGDAHAKVAQFMDWCWPLLEALEFVGTAVFLVGLDYETNGVPNLVSLLRLTGGGNIGVLVLLT